MDKQMWLVYSVLAGLCWGTYVPLVQQGIRGLSMNSFASFLCVGMAYFVIAILFPLAMFFSGAAPKPTWTGYGITFATLAGAAGAAGALFVIFANRAAPDPSYRMYIPPIIFALAPVLNTVVSLVWHATPSEGAFVFGIKHLPGWKFYLGIVMIASGAALVLFSKEEAEQAGKHVKGPAKTAPVVASVEPGSGVGS